tara:strand:+ start:693 stop:1544 length:852 start_codon:yes stop_codon:yes gene_type:complete
MINAMNISKRALTKIVKDSIAEDHGYFGDITSKNSIHKDTIVSGTINSNQSGIISGIDCARLTFSNIDKNIEFSPKIKDGEQIQPNGVIANISGNAISILSAERVALNFIGHLSGIATETRKYVDRIAHTNAKVLSTRKTTPLIRALEKYAVRSGGGFNHRFGLDYGILVKDNHIKSAGGIDKIIKNIKGKEPYLTSIEVEVDTEEQFLECQSLDVKYILLDNMSIEEMKRCISLNTNQATLEASGGINLQNVKKVAETGVDYISIGRITHSSPSLDVSLHIH